MAQAVSIVPRRRRVEEVRVLRRLKTRCAVQTFAAATSALAMVLVSPLHSHGLLIVLGGVALVSGTSALVLRLVEEPRETVVRKVHHEPEPPLVH
jgi:hypothetical protein